MVCILKSVLPVRTIWQPLGHRRTCQDTDQSLAFSRYLKPGGRIEISEARTKINCDDGTIPEDSYMYKWEVSDNKTRHPKFRVPALNGRSKNSIELQKSRDEYGISLLNFRVSCEELLLKMSTWSNMSVRSAHGPRTPS